ncbi:hypothetical protein PoB_000286600 [Plakobranchus ocellatus]|uniref:Uncharacterized protein n=1 Tax=Plakobranchus ocellatus TaxID=259542 RepID=A0AAV3Y1V5_9GAST|nr:hypothetical protein PoB_000286600 [Plakobranchus ocellatus]
MGKWRYHKKWQMTVPQEMANGATIVNANGGTTKMGNGYNKKWQMTLPKEVPSGATTGNGKWHYHSKMANDAITRRHSRGKRRYHQKLSNGATTIKGK